MTEILQINFGQQGNNIGHQYLEKLILDHHLEKGNNIEITNGKVGISFDEDKNQQLLYRGAFIDFDSKSIDKILTSPSSNFIDPNLLIQNNCCNISGTFNCSSYLYGEMKNEVEDGILKCIEKCDRLDNINYVYSTFDKYCGFATQTLKDLYDQFPNLLHSNITIFPSLKCSNPIEIYNTTFAIHNLVELSQFTMVYDYDALQCATLRLKVQSNLDNYHEIIAENILQSNCSSRMSGYQNFNYRKIAVNLIPFPRLHFLTCSFNYLKPADDLFQQIYSLSSLQNAYYTYPKDFQNKYMSQAYITRTSDKYLQINQFNGKMQNQIDWIPDGILHANCKIPHRFLGETAMHIGNQRRFGLTLQPIGEIFTASFRRKAFLHYYTAEGADEMDFTEAESNLNDFISEYQDYCCQAYPEDDYSEEEEY